MAARLIRKPGPPNAGGHVLHALRITARDIAERFNTDREVRRKLRELEAAQKA